MPAQNMVLTQGSHDRSLKLNILYVHIDLDSKAGIIQTFTMISYIYLTFPPYFVKIKIYFFLLIGVTYE